MGNSKKSTGPFTIKASFRLLKERAEQQLKDENKMIRLQSQAIVDLFEQHPILEQGFTDDAKEVKEHQQAIGELMSFLFPSTLAANEIKCAVLPYTNELVYSSTRFAQITEDSGLGDTVLESLFAKENSASNFIPYAIILNKHFGYQIDFAKAMHVDIPDKSGKKRTYRVAYNADFLEISPNETAIDITPEMVTEILANADDPETWKKYFPNESWTIEGFGVINMLDITLDTQYDNFKTDLIQTNTHDNFLRVVEDVRDIFALPNLDLGVFTLEGQYVSKGYDKNIRSYSLGDLETIHFNEYACNYVQKKLFENHEVVIISNVELYKQQSHGNRFSERLLENGIKSLFLLPIVIENELRYVMEVVAKEVNQLNIINFSKMETLLPFIQSYSERITDEFENQISAVIQRECTSIHPAVKWRFEEEALKYIQETSAGDSASFQEVIFEDVLPLYGQVDIVGSSKARNEAIQQDLAAQLKSAMKVLRELHQKQDLPLYEQMIYQCEKYLQEVELAFNTNTEQSVQQFFKHQILPLFHYENENNKSNTSVQSFIERLDSDTESYYVARKEYDDTVNQINKKLAKFLDKKQEKAQQIFPHYFEKYKTDGVEHNLYVGQSITNQAVYHPSVVYNLRLWQLQVMCEMEAKFYKQQAKYPIDLKVASLILSYDVPITIRYRIDEKQFDVDGSYNVRYEMIKKRIDKAHIKNTDERITQPHKLCVVYSDPSIEREYLSYFEFLQAKGYIGDEIEIVELEELQGASGMKAIRAAINHELENAEKIFSVDDLAVS